MLINHTKIMKIAIQKEVQDFRQIFKGGGNRRS
jgi:hypothetical protein